MRLIDRLATGLRWIAIVALLVMMLVTVIDITMRLVINQLVLGSVEIVQLTIVVVVFLALPETFLRDQHIVVDAIDQFVPARWKIRLQLAGILLTLLLLAVMAARMLPQALDTLQIGDRSTDLQISLFWYWFPLLLGIVASVAAVAARLVLQLSAPERMRHITQDSANAE
jgi:TRAP-type C4-dicarboxylate transport system permease small subunit